MARIESRVVKIKISLTANFVRAGFGKNLDAAAAAETHPVVFSRKRAAIDANLPDGRFRG